MSEQTFGDLGRRVDKLEGLPHRVAKIEAHMEHMATKAWVLGGVVGGMVAAALVTLAVARLVLQAG